MKLFNLKPTIMVIIGLLFLTLPLMQVTAQVNPAVHYLRVNTSNAVNALLVEAKTHFERNEFEQAAAKLERALRIDPRNPILWHNLAGVRLKQEDWKRAASLAAKSNALAVNDNWLQVRNWMLISWACEGMGDNECAKAALNRARQLAG